MLGDGGNQVFELFLQDIRIQEDIIPIQAIIKPPNFSKTIKAKMLPWFIFRRVVDNIRNTIK